MYMTHCFCIFSISLIIDRLNNSIICVNGIMSNNSSIFNKNKALIIGLRLRTNNFIVFFLVFIIFSLYFYFANDMSPGYR